MAKIKRFVKYVPSNGYGFFNSVDYVYFNSKKWFAVRETGIKEVVDGSHAKFCISRDLWREDGTVPKNTKHKTGLDPKKSYLLVDSGYIWLAKGKDIIKEKPNKKYIVKTKKELKNEFYIGSRFIVEVT